MNIAIPIFRARIKGSDNKFITGNLNDDNVIDGAVIDEDTLSIHFPDMIDINDKKIFASLRADKAYGDVMTRTYCSPWLEKDDPEYERTLYFVAVFHKNTISWEALNDNASQNFDKAYPEEVIDIYDNKFNEKMIIIMKEEDTARREHKMKLINAKKAK